MQLEIKNIGKCYGEKEALKELTLQLSPGIYGLLGPNGAGKSTLMKLICMLIEPTTGTILFDGKDIRTERKNFLKRLGYMPQQHCLYPEFRVEEYLHYIGTLKGMNKKSVEKSTEELLKKVRLLDVRTQKIRTLSGGMQQRLMFAQALLDNPKVLILDEPTAGLDPEKRIEMRNLIAEYAKDKIIIIATHVVSDVELIADKILLLKKGELLAKSSVLELTKSLYGKVCELEVEEELEILEKQYRISSVYRREGKIYAKVLLKTGEKLPEKAAKVYPDLEDVYLYYFRGSEE
ncbi:MAG: ATP-binding cassette domain-containing protein [Blautia sp.]|nr:ATP-binding cassette domain-containing protein [Blautia sp.]